MAPAKVLFQMTGSIACYKACHVISRLVQAGCEVQTVATEAALRFVGESTLEGLTSRPVARETFQTGRQMDHIHLARWADLAVLAPASGNTLNRLAAGLADDLIGAVFLAWDFRRPYLIAPAMNSQMFAHPATQASVARLAGWGVQVLETETGPLACGEKGPGRLLDPEQILARVLEAAGRPRGENPPATAPAPDPVSENPPPNNSRGPAVLITAGGTREAIDGVRYITNFSTGHTGAIIADTLAGRGFQVTCLHGLDAELPRSVKRRIPFTDFADLDRRLGDLLGGEPFDAVIHLAAVSDYSVDHLECAGQPCRPDEAAKLASDAELKIVLKPNPKLVEGLRARSRNPHIRVVAFKLTHQAGPDQTRAAVNKLARHPGVDFVVHNELVDTGRKAPARRYTVYRRNQMCATVGNREDLAALLADLLAPPPRLTPPTPEDPQ